VLWLSEPDHTGHHTPLGSPPHREAIAQADANVARVLAAVERLDPGGNEILFAVSSDHGMQTIRHRVDIAARLVAAGFKASEASADVVVAPQGTSALLHFAAEARDRIAPLAGWLTQQPFAGRIAVGDELASLGLPVGGTLAIALGLAGDDETNEYGVRGRSDVAENALGGESLPGHGQHGGLGTYEQSPFLALRGGGFVPGLRERPVSLIDLAPTMLRHLELGEGDMDGHALPRSA
jgi:arylsulfatase A-like enzyme